MRTKKWIMMVLFTMMLLLGLPMGVSAKTSIKLNTKSKAITVGKTYTLKATVKGTKKKIAWTSSNTAVATVNNNGKISAKKAGKAVIKAKVNGKTARCTISVKAPNYAKKGIYKKTYSGAGTAIEQLIVLKVSGGKIRFVVEHYGRGGLTIYQTNTITAKLNSNKTSTFRWKDSWGNSGTGKLTFKKNKVSVKMNVKKESSMNYWMWWNKSMTMTYSSQKLTSANIKYYSDLSF